MKIASFFTKRGPLAALAAGGGAIAVAAAASAGLAGPASAALSGPRQPAGTATTVRLDLAPMPHAELLVGAGTVALTGYGFTPGSGHEVALSAFGFDLPVGTVTASATGTVSWQASLGQLGAAAVGDAGSLLSASGAGVRLTVLDAGQGSPVIARSPVITGLGRYRLKAVEPGFGVIKAGQATLVYDPAAQTISVTVTATGLAPGAHAAHIHLGSCQAQGAVAYMLPDFTADAHGVIGHETRTVSGVTAARLAGGWYLNLHQGNSGNIVSNGQPTVNFRPVECANI